MPAAGPSELEAALIIRSKSPRRLAEQIGALNSIAGYRLHAEAPQPIHDLYFDTAGRVLAAKRIALRLRTIGSDHLLTVKGPSRLTDWGAAERPELEEPYSTEAVARMVDVLGPFNEGRAPCGRPGPGAGRGAGSRDPPAAPQCHTTG